MSDELVLLAEDDPGVRRFVARALQQCGYRVLIAVDGEDALELFAAHREEIDLVVCDLAMPRRDGRQLLEAVRREAPLLPAILMSGHGGFDEEPCLPSGVGLLPKPFLPEDLAVAARRALDAARR